MTSWYKAICDQHREVCTVFCVHQRTPTMLGIW